MGLIIYSVVTARKRGANSDQTPALKIANQCNYGNVNYNWSYTNSNWAYTGDAAPSFYGYPSTGPASGNANMGYGGWNIEVSVNFSDWSMSLYIS